MIETVRIDTGPASGGAGIATANATGPHAVVGRILGVILEYKDSPPATTDVTIASAGSNHPAITLLTLTNVTANGLFMPRHKVVDESGVNISYETTNAKDVYDAPVISDRIKVTIAQANDGDSVVATVIYEGGR